MKSIDAYWYDQNPVAWLLLPLSLFYCIIVYIRRNLYKTGIFKSQKLPVPVIVIGNINVGGTGKTPLIIALSELLKQHGFKPGIVSRGYGGNYSGQKLVEANDSSIVVGDEPLLIAKRTANPVAIGRDRVAAARLLLEHHECNIILSDDGMQHYRMQRDIEIAVIDAIRQFGNGYCLPSGPLRESTRRLQDVDIIVHHGASTHPDNFTLTLSAPVNLLSGDTCQLSDFKGKKVHAMAGIGNPERFFQQLEKTGLSIERHSYPDHHYYTAADLDNIYSDNEIIIMTEKDAMKCQAIASENSWYIPATAILSDYLVDNFMERIRQV